MSNYIYGAATTLCIMAMVNIIDRNVPQDVWHWVGAYIPF